MEVIAPESSPAKRYVGGTSGYLCECRTPCKPMEVHELIVEAYKRFPRKYLMLDDNIAQDMGISAYTVGYLRRQYGDSTCDDEGRNMMCMQCGTHERVEMRESAFQEKCFPRCEACQERCEQHSNRHSRLASA